MRFLPTLACKVTTHEVQPSLGESMLESGDEVHREPLMGCRSLLGPFFIARWARSLCCHLCSSQTIPSVLGNRVSITGYTRSRVHHRRTYLWGTVFHERHSPLFPWPLPLPERGPARQWLPAALLPSPLESWKPRGLCMAELSAGCWRAPAGEAAWPQADAGVGAAVGWRAGEPGGLSLMW